MTGTLLNHVLGLEPVFTRDEKIFLGSDLPKLNYSHKNFEGCLHIAPHPILSDFGIQDYQVEVQNHKAFHKMFFRTAGGPEIPFDIFGAAFWLLTRYEEYLPHKKDKFGRFHYKSSLAWQSDFLQVPLVNLWMMEFKRILSSRYPALQFRERKYNYISTIDIDSAYLYKYKGFVRTVAGYSLDLLRRNFSGIRERTRILLGKKKDPYDCYSQLLEIKEQAGVDCIFFLLLGDYGVNDKNISSSSQPFRSLIQHLGDYAEVGIHPSFASNNSLHQLKVEINRLSNITHRQVNSARQHFSMLRFPDTYLALQQSGISDDHSMGFTNMNGFRASFCHPYKWYSFEDESITSLTIHPFCFTENTAEYYSHHGGSGFEKAAEDLVSEVRKYRGEMVSIFHNGSFTGEMQNKYFKLIDLAKS